MSHVVFNDTEIKDKRLLAKAAQATGVKYIENGDSIRFTSGPLADSTLDLKTGRIVGDSDYGHTANRLGALKQAYGEAEYRQQCAREGVEVESRSVDREGNVVLLCSMA